jgi:hypothetical protein
MRGQAQGRFVNVHESAPAGIGSSPSLFRHDLAEERVLLGIILASAIGRGRKTALAVR